jgi:ArsR family transcriptional regulator, arsenate/arsenite/antimonite-responsive transcriptional repressor
MDLSTKECVTPDPEEILPYTPGKMAAPLVSLTRLVKAMAHPTRLRILAMLADGELCVCQLTAVLKLAPSTVSAHLGELKRAGLILEEKRAKFVFYVLSPDQAARKWHRQAIEALGDDPAVTADRELVARIRRVPVEEFAASRSDLTLLPVHPAGGKQKRTVATRSSVRLRAKRGRE